MSRLDEQIKGKLTYSLCGKWYEVYGTLIEKKGNYFELLKENGKKIIGSCSD